jgi:cytosine/adenosine deaminase-related metal-dependent hydrolase
MLNDKNVQDGKFKYIPSPHSIYSCESVLIRKIKALSEETGLPFSIHLAESIEESEFTVNNSGGLKDFLIKRGIPHGFIETYGLSPVKYLNSIGGLCHGMVAVHCVHIDDVDIDILAENGVRIVTCPGSNQFLDNGIALLEKFMEKGISISIGTDSAASNDKLDIFKEMQIIKEEHPLIPSSEIIKMATINGAKTLDFDDRYGTIEAGKIAELIALPLPENSVSWNAGQVEDYIVKECSGDNVIRINL